VSLRLTGVTYRYAGSDWPVLQDLDLQVALGEVVGVVGANESGKSTLALVASGLAPRSIGGTLDGTVLIDDLDTAEAPAHALAQRCGTLFQNPNTQLSGTARTVWEEVAFGPRNVGLPLGEVVERVESAVEALHISDLIERDPGRLSGGQAQLVALASVVALRPRYLVLDEPTSQLDPAGTRLVSDALRDLATTGSAGILIVEHKTDLLARLAARIVVLRGGRIVRSGATREALADPALASEGVRAPEAIAIRRQIEASGRPGPESLLRELERESHVKARA
jgi:energy-coupling factor transport system ATP-binding protein